MKAIFPRLTPVLPALFVLNTTAMTRYVDLNSPSPTPPYTSWTTAATNIQHAIDAAVAGDQILVTNGVYQTGGQVANGGLTNRVAVTKPVTLQSVNGPTVTLIKGYQVPVVTNDDGAVRCVYLTNGAALVGFTLTNGATRSTDDAILDKQGGGILSESNDTLVTNCVVTGCASTDFGGGVASGTINNCALSNNMSFTGGGVAWAALNHCRITDNHAATGGGGYSVTLNNCLIARNTTIGRAAGAWNSILNNCTVTSNSAASDFAGGIWRSSARNCILYYNWAPTEPDYSGVTADHCCSTPLLDGIGNFTNAPSFVNLAGGNFRLASDSACINGGDNAQVVSSGDLDGRPRIVGGTVDLGAYEFQGAGMSDFIGWLQQYNLPTDGTADFADTDGDGASNWLEWQADTIPTNSLSAFRIVSVTNSPSGAAVTWQSVSTRNYFVQRATELGSASPFQTIATNIPGISGTITYVETDANGSAASFYRVSTHAE